MDQSTAKENEVQIGDGVIIESGLDKPLPELKLSIIQKSPNQVLKLYPDEQSSRERGFIQTYGEYTVVLGRGEKEIQVFDKQGKRIEGLTNTRTMIIDWTALTHEGVASGGYPFNRMTTLDKTRLTVEQQKTVKTVDQFPQRLQETVRQYIKEKGDSKGIALFPTSGEWRLDLSDMAEISASVGDGCIIFYEQGSQNWIAFQTKDERGIELPPRNWKRFDLADEWAKRLPPEISKRLTLARIEGLKSVRQIENGYFILTFSDKLAVVKQGQKVEDAEFTDQLVGIGNNVCLDPRNPGVIYYCTSDNPRLLVKLDTTKDPGSWVTETVDIPQEYKNIRNLSLDPTGNFFMFESNNEFVILTKDTLQEVQKIPRLRQATVDAQGKIRGLDESGYLVFYDANFQEVSKELEKRRVSRLAQGLSTDLFKKESATEQVDIDQYQHLIPIKTDLEARFDSQLQTITSLEDVSTASEALNRLRTRLQAEGLQPAEISFITQGIQNSISNKERVLAAPVAAQGLVELNTKLAGNLTIAVIAEAKGDLAKLKSLEGLVDDATRAQIRTLEIQLGQQSTDLYRREGAVIEKDVGEMVGGVRVELEGMISMPDFADWQEFRLPQLISRLGSMANDCPIEASETQRTILAARRQLQELARDYEKRFKEKYAQVREKASEVIGERVELMKTEMDSLVDRLRNRGFSDRSQAESYVRSSEALEVLRTEIAELARQNPDAAKELDRDLKVRLATVMSEIERGGLTSVAETGQQMIYFGNTLFPRWEGKVQERGKRQFNLVFIADDKTKGPEVSADKILGDIGIVEINSRGKAERKRLYEGMQDEDEWRYGSVSYRGEYTFPAYVSQEEYRKIKQDWADWSRGDASKVRQSLKEKREALRSKYKERQGVRVKSSETGKYIVQGRDSEADEKWQEEYTKLLQDYAEFSAENHVLLLSRVDKLQQAPETEFANGSGYVPEWQSHWTADETTEHDLEEMAKLFRMQLDLQEGILGLKGHAGVGKDVLLKMFCNRTNRPYFGFDCSKWTTEFELSEDIVLESKEGASVTIKVPSVILNGIQTPGAVVYFNEFTAMPEQAQIFLHALTDEKRTLTLKTSSGKAIRADRSVLLACSRNPGYPGTFDPQFATKSRMVELEISYPSLYKQRDPNDPNPNPPISAAEALRVARQVDSLADFTYEANPQHNEFVKIWDRYVNGIENGAPDLTQVQRFDVEAILAMVEFAQKLREGFILKFEKRPASEIKGKLTVDQPITGREMRRMAYFLSKMTPEEKTTADPEAVTRGLIERFFLSHIDNQKERDEIRTAMATWTSSKRPAA